MIAYIKGKLTTIKDNAVIVDVHGIGYELICPNPYVFEPEMNQQVQIHTHHHVREDAQILFGFRNTDEKYLFTKLISVSFSMRKPRWALTLTSVLSALKTPNA